MSAIIDTADGRIVGYDPKSQELLIRAKYTDYPTLLRREYKACRVTLKDSRPLSDKQRKSCYAMLTEIAEWSGNTVGTEKELHKIRYNAEMIGGTAERLFSLSDAPMSVVADFQRYLVRFIVEQGIPTRKPLLNMVDDIGDYTYSCLVNKRCCVCGKQADLHHIDRVGMGRDRTDIIHLGMNVLPLCRAHHTEAHTMPDKEFFDKYHLDDGIEADRTICKIYGLKTERKK